MNIDIELPVVTASNDIEDVMDKSFHELDLNLEMHRFLNIDVISQTEEDGVIYPLVYSGAYSYLIGMTVKEFNQKINKALKK